MRGTGVDFRALSEVTQVMSDSQLTTIGRLEDRLGSLKVRL